MLFDVSVMKEFTGRNHSSCYIMYSAGPISVTVLVSCKFPAILGSLGNNNRCMSFSDVITFSSFTGHFGLRYMIFQYRGGNFSHCDMISSFCDSTLIHWHAAVWFCLNSTVILTYTSALDKCIIILLNGLDQVI